MAESTPTREDIVEANIAAVKTAYGNDAYLAIIAQCAQDISISMAMLLDGNER